MSKQAITLKPFKVGLAKHLDIFPTFCAPDDGTNGQKQYIEEGILNLCHLARVFEFGKELHKSSVVVHNETPVKGA